MDQSVSSINPVCPNKPQIPYKPTPTFCPKQENSSYLNWQEQQNEKPQGSKMAFAQLTGGDHFDGHCCDKVAKIIRGNQKQISEQLVTMSQLNILIDEHSKLLEKSQQQLLDERKRKENELAKSLDITQDLNSKDKAIEDLKQKYNKQLLENQQKDHKIQKLKEKLAEVEEQVNQSTTVTSLKDEVNTWKNRYLNLNKNNDETQEKLKQLEQELQKLKEKGSDPADSSQTTVTTTTVRRQKQKEQQQE